MDKHELNGLVGTMVSGFVGTLGLKNIDKKLLQPYIDQTIDSLLSGTENEQGLSKEEFKVRNSVANPLVV